VVVLVDDDSFDLRPAQIDAAAHAETVDGCRLFRWSEAMISPALGEGSTV
jgi:hypothetical protein